MKQSEKISGTFKHFQTEGEVGEQANLKDYELEGKMFNYSFCHLPNMNNKNSNEEP